MLSVMWDTLLVAMLLSVGVIVAAFIAEGRGQHLMRVIFGMTERRGAAHIFDDVPRTDNTWDIVGAMESSDTRELEFIRR